MTLTRLLRWMLIILIMGGFTAVGYAYWYWNKSDEILRQEVLKKIAEVAPEWDIDIGRTRFDWGRRIQIYDLTLRTKSDAAPLVTIPQATITIDREKLSRDQQVVIQKIVLRYPTLNLIRDSAGHWNWQDLPKIAEPDKTMSLPDLKIQTGSVQVTLNQAGNVPPTTISLKNAEAQLISSAKRQFLIQGLTQVQEAGNLTLKGSWNIDEKTWSLEGDIRDVVSNGQILSLAVGASPELQERISKLESALRKLASPSHPEQIATDASIADTVPNLGISATLDVHFQLARVKPDLEPQFELGLTVQNGQITNPVLPFPLHDIAGKIHWDNEKVVVQKLSAKNGVTHLTVNGKLNRSQDITPGRFRVDIHDLRLDNRIYQRLPPVLQKQYAMLQPSGYVDLKGMIDFDGVKTWTPRDFLLTAKGCSIRHVKFPYTIQDILGTVVQRGKTLSAEFVGRAGRQNVNIEGTVTNPGPEAKSEFIFQVERFPIDDALLAACDKRARETLNDLNLKGHADVWYRFYRPPGLNQSPTFELVADLKDCAMEYVHFPYQLSNLTGTVAHSSSDGSWVFKDLRARHGTAAITGKGRFLQFAGIKTLDLTLDAENAEFDEELETALPASLQKVWEDFSPAGKLSVKDAKILWAPGREAEITLPRIKVSDASFEMRAFPLPIKNAEATLSYKRIKQTGTDRVAIHSFSGNHDNTHISTQNGYSEFHPNGEWRVRLENMQVDDLIPDRKFRIALPDDLRIIFDDLNPQGAISFSGMMEFRGTQSLTDPVTAAWDLNTILPGNDLTTGIDLKQAAGKISMSGTWDGRQAVMAGFFLLDSVHIWDHQLTHVRGPFRLNNNRLTIGSDKVFLQRQSSIEPPNIPLSQRITAKAIGGTVTFDADVRLERETSYQVKLALNHGRLEEYARRYLPGVNNLQGAMTGEVYVQGKGSESDDLTGNGFLQVSSAALYELPVVLKIFQRLSLSPSDRSAFSYALLKFNIANNHFLFNEIALVGNSINFYGQGAASFDGVLNLSLLSELPKSRRIPIPIVEDVLREATKNWIGISVRGNINSPQVESKAAPHLDKAFSRIFKALETRPSSPRSRRPFSPSNRRQSRMFPFRNRSRNAR